MHLEHRSPLTRRPDDTGFTLVEAVVLIAIVGIVAVNAAPRFLSVADMDATRAHRQALTDLRFAHQLALASGCPVQVDFAVDRYELTQRTGCRVGAFSRAVTDPTTNSVPFLIVAPVGVALASDVDPLVFDARGRTTTLAGAVRTAHITVGPRSLEAIGETGLVRVP